MDVLENRIASALGSSVDHVAEIGGGYTHSRLVRAHLSNGSSIVVKVATDERTAGDVRFEARVLSNFALECMPQLVAVDDTDPPFIVLEDLGAAHWPPPWPDLDRFFATVEAVGTHPAPNWLPPLRDDRVPTWEAVMGKRHEVAATGVVTVEWLERAAPVLSESASQASVEGDGLVHSDIWSSNVCFTGDRVVLIDWAGAARGNPDFDRAISTADVFVTTGVLPDHDWPNRRSMSALLAALKCNAVTLGKPDWATDDWHANQVNDLIWLLRWAAIEHDLPDPGA